MPVLADPGGKALLMTTAPRATAEDAVLIARRDFGIEARAQNLISERDANFHLTATDGREFVLKIANSAEDPAVTNLQTAALRHIEWRDPGLPVPRLCAARDGRFEITLDLGGARHVARLLTFLAGEPLYRSASSVAQRQELGRCLARIGLALRDFAHPAAAHEILWDLKQAPRLRALLPHIADEGRRALAARGIDNYQHLVAPGLATFRRQVVHNDFNPYNVLVEPGYPARIAGVLDFGDLVETPLVNDVAVAASYLVEGDDPFGRALDLIGAYHAVSPLLPDEVDCLYDLIILRQTMTVTIAAWRATLYPENGTYILRNQTRAAAAMETLLAFGRDKARALLHRACPMEST